jgi:hypothetical protein
MSNFSNVKPLLHPCQFVYVAQPVITNEALPTELWQSAMEEIGLLLSILSVFMFGSALKFWFGFLSDSPIGCNQCSRVRTEFLKGNLQSSYVLNR